MTDLPALLAAVAAAPADDTPRLVLADWLDDHATASGQCGACDGHGLIGPDGRGSSEGTTCEACRGFGGWTGNGYRERAEFIRVQVELARMVRPVGLDRSAPVGMFGERERRFHKWGKNSPWGKRRAALQEREAALFATHGADWFGPAATLHPWGRPEGSDYPVVSRGFVSEWRGLLDRWIADGPAIVAAHPICRVVISDREPMPEHGGGGGWHWTWASNLPPPVGRAGLPRELMRQPVISSSGIACLFRTPAAALDALSTAALAYCRAAAAEPAPAA